MKIKRDDNVIVLTGKDKTKKGKVLKVLGERIIVSGINKTKRHIKAKTKSEKGSIVERESSIHISNVKLDK